MDATLRENRVFERFPARFPVKFKHSANEYGTEVFLRDASAQGVKITTKERFFLHDSLSLLVKLPGTSQPLELNGRVVWSKTEALNLWDIGVEFHKINLMKVHRLYDSFQPAG